MKTKHWQAVAVAALAAVALVPAVAEEQATLKADRVNVRGEASVNSEVITQLRAGEKVTVLEEITVEKPKPGEPARWARILLPSNTPVWVHTLFLDPETKTVKVNRLNVRAGPGENFSIVARLEKGAAVKEIRTVDHWMEIEPPPNTHAFVSAEFIEKVPASAVVEAPAKPAEPAMAESKPVEKPARKPGKAKPAVPAKAPEPIVTVETVKVEPPPVPVVDAAPATAVQPAPMKAPAVEAPSLVTAAPAIVAPPPPVEPPPLVTKPTPQTTAPTLPAPLVTPPAIVAPPPAEPAPPAANEPPPRRIVSREGIVKRAWSIQAPTPFVLSDSQTGKTINYLYAEDTGLQLKYYTGQRILISGEEKIDPRWPATPLITIKTLEHLR